MLDRTRKRGDTGGKEKGGWEKRNKKMRNGKKD